MSDLKSIERARIRGLSSNAKGMKRLKPSEPRRLRARHDRFPMFSAGRAIHPFSDKRLPFVRLMDARL
jgi:hypothetical protein